MYTGPNSKWRKNPVAGHLRHGAKYWGFHLLRFFIWSIAHAALAAVTV